MKVVTYGIAILVILGVLLVGYTSWLNNDTKIEFNIEEKGVAILGDTYGMEEIDIVVNGTFTSAKLDSGGIFLGEIKLGETVLNMDSSSGGLRLDYKRDIIYGYTELNEGEIVSIVFSTDFTTGSFKFTSNDQYIHYPYNGERLLAIKDIVESEFKKIID